jgi:hypothetical protein
MKKSKWNLIIDAIMFISMMALIGVGLLTKYVLLTGQKKWDKFGNNCEFSWLGLDRQGWNDIHFILGLVLVGLLVLHILLHWKMTIGIYKSLIKNRGLRILIGWFILFLSLLLVFFFYLVEPVVEDSTVHFRNRNPEVNSQIIQNEVVPVKEGKNELITEKPAAKPVEEIHHEHNPNIEVIGSMTLDEIYSKYAVPADYIKKELNIPISTSNNERLGRLRRSYGFTMSRIEEIIDLYQKQNNIKN